MRSRILAAAAGVILLGGAGTGAALAAGSGPGPNGNNNGGLCKAYFSGSQQGQTQKQDHGVAFVQLAAQAAAWDSTDDMSSSNTEGPETGETPQEQVQEYCAANGG